MMLFADDDCGKFLSFLQFFVAVFLVWFLFIIDFIISVVRRSLLNQLSAALDKASCGLFHPIFYFWQIVCFSMRFSSCSLHLFPNLFFFAAVFKILNIYLFWVLFFVTFPLFLMYYLIDFVYGNKRAIVDAKTNNRKPQKIDLKLGSEALILYWGKEVMEKFCI